MLVIGAAFAPASPPHRGRDGRRLIAERLPRIGHHGGPFLRRPEITTVTFRGDDPTLVSRLEEFGRQIARSPWWREVTAGYCAIGAAGDCIGLGSAGRTVRLARRLPSRTRDVDIEAVIAAEAIGGALAGLGPDALVVVYLPAGVALRDAFHPAYCGDGPRAYHRMVHAGSMALPYVVVPRCQGEAETTATASHEILEAATNPDPDRPGFRFGPGPATAGFAAFGAEPADPCRLMSFDRHRAVEAGFTMQRAWSNRAAERGADPCVPSDPDRPFVALVPRQPVVRVAPGATVSVVLDAASDRAVQRWTVSVTDLAGGREGEPWLQARLDRSEVAEGDVAVLTLRRIGVPDRQMSFVGLVSDLDGQSHLWPLVVTAR
jgi:hypothetical protein